MERRERSRGGLLIVAVMLITGDDLALAATASAPVLATVDPPGVTLGELTEWTVTGRGLAGVDRFLISGEGIEVVKLQDGSGESITVKVRAPADAAPGFRELRAVGPGGISNLLLFRVDHLPQTREVEPNDGPATANPVPIPSAVSGILGPRDLDHFAFAGRAGQQVTIEVEGWRLGSPIVPVATVLDSSGASLALSRPVRDGGRDGRLSFVAPTDGRYLIQVRDALYHAGDSAQYRLRIDPGPFATGLFPLGGPRGATIRVAATGGNLRRPYFKEVTLPDEPGAIVEAGALAGPDGSLLAPARLAVGDGPEVVEPHEGPTSTPMRLAFGTTANGRIGLPGEVDRYAVAVRAGEMVRVEVQAASLGSWLDAVLTLDDARGDRIAENDDRARGTPDSRVDFEARTEGEVVVAITDRFGDGGPEYAYRLSIGPPRPDFTVTLRPGSPPGASGALNLSPGTSLPLRFQIAGEGRLGPIAVRADGLPPGVAAEPVFVRLPRSGRGATSEGTLVLKVEPGAGPALGSIRIVATARSADGTALTRHASTTLVLGSMPPGDPRPPPTRAVTEFPVAIVAPARAPLDPGHP